ncbi:MAG: hypothetical protein AUK63_1710 [bacterium P3]|nr:MAG: hypothetical protein AUK63_1710 [bacterium P3]KWW38917.1 MAG: hypothetical protein F083_2036 [bacterium F083]
MKKGLRITLIAVGVLLLLVILATLTAAPIAKNYINRHGEELTGRRIQLDELRLNIYSGHIALRRMALYEEDGTTPFVSFDTLDVRFKPLKLLRSEINIKSLILSGLNVRVEQRDTVFNFSSLLARFAGDGSEPDDTAASPWLLSFHNVALRHGQIHYADLGRDSRWDFNDLNLRIPDFTMGGEQAADAGLTLLLGDGGRLSADVRYDIKSNDLAATVDLQHFNLAQIKPYLADIVRLDALEGSLGLHLDAKGNLSRINALVFSGSLALDNLRVTDPREELAACRRIAVDIRDIDLGRNRYHIGSVAVDGLTSHYDLRRQGSTFSGVAVPAAPAGNVAAPSPAASDSAAPRPAPDLVVDHFELNDAAFTFADHTLPDAFLFPVHNIRISADNLRLHGDNAARITADLPDGGRAVVHWRGDISDWRRHQDLLLVISNLKLTRLSPYLVAHLGQPFTEGTLSFHSRNRIHHSQLDGRNHVDIYKIDVGQRRSDVDAPLRLPLKAALYILKDKDEKIDLELPVAGNIDSPEFSYMKLVWKTLGNLLVKVTTSPLRALGDALGIGGADLEFLAVDPEQYDFTSEQYYHIESLAKLMQRDTLIGVTFEQQLHAAEEDALLQRADHRNALLRHHLDELGLPASRYEVTTVMSDTVQRPGYRILSHFNDNE